jgi:hypothetical protein
MSLPYMYMPYSFYYMLMSKFHKFYVCNLVPRRLKIYTQSEYRTQGGRPGYETICYVNWSNILPPLFNIASANSVTRSLHACIISLVFPRSPASAWLNYVGFICIHQRPTVFAICYGCKCLWPCHSYVVSHLSSYQTFHSSIHGCFIPLQEIIYHLNLMY